MNLTQYKNKYGREAIPWLVSQTGWPYSQFYRVIAGSGKGGMSLERCEALARIEPELDPVAVHKEWRQNRDRRNAA